MFRSRSLRPSSTIRAVAFAILGPGVAFGLGLLIDRRSLVGATSLCLFAVLVAATLGGRRSGLAASVVAFLGLNFFFTPPYHRFTVERGADVIALFVFLAVSVIVGTLLTLAIEERARAERRVAEARFLDRITARPISGGKLEEALGEFGRDLVALFGLARCEIVPGEGAAAIVAVTPGDAPAAEGPAVSLPLGTGGGSILAVRPAGA